MILHARVFLCIAILLYPIRHLLVDWLIDLLFSDLSILCPGLKMRLLAYLSSRLQDNKVDFIF